MNNHVITPEQWAEYKALQRLRVLGYVRKEMLDMCQRGGNAAALTLVPVAPKSGAWVAVYVEGKEE